jgi:hypothetical protein
MDCTCHRDSSNRRSSLPGLLQKNQEKNIIHIKLIASEARHRIAWENVGDLKHHASWKRERSKVDLDSRKGTRR